LKGINKGMEKVPIYKWKEREKLMKKLKRIKKED
jgi:hypothetical protein